MISSLSIRDATQADVPAMAAIYNHYVNCSDATFETEEVSREERIEWFSQFAMSGPHRAVVAERDGKVVGYATSSQFHPKPIYSRTVEMGLYVVEDQCRSGVGSELYGSLLKGLSHEASVDRMVASIKLPNEASVALHEKFGFKPVGTFRRVGERRGRVFDLCWYDRPARLMSSG